MKKIFINLGVISVVATSLSFISCGTTENKVKTYTIDLSYQTFNKFSFNSLISSAEDNEVIRIRIKNINENGDQITKRIIKTEAWDFVDGLYKTTLRGLTTGDSSFVGGE